MIIQISNDLKPVENSNSVHHASVINRDALFGDGFFTTGLIEDNRFHYQQLHFNRLIKTADKLGFKGFDCSLLEKLIKPLLKDTKQAIIRITITRIQSQRGYAVSESAEIVCKISLSPYVINSLEPCELFLSNVAISNNKTLAGLKHLNRLDSVLAANEITKNNQEVLMLDQQNVICGSRSNLFVMINGCWHTPILDECGIEGIARSRVLSLFDSIKEQCLICKINKKDLEKASSAFVTNSIVGVWPVTLLNGQKIDMKASSQVKKLLLQ